MKTHPIGKAIVRAIRGEPPAIPKYVWSRGHTERGKTTSSWKYCGLAGCPGFRLQVLWKKGNHTWPCTKGMKIRKPNEWEIE